MNIDLNIDTGKLKSDLTDAAVRMSKEICNRQLDVHFRSGAYGGKKGDGYKMIEDMVYEHLLSDDVSVQIKKIIDERWNEVLENAVMYALSRKANKVAQLTVIEGKTV